MVCALTILQNRHDKKSLDKILPLGNEIKKGFFLFISLAYSYLCTENQTITLWKSLT